MLSSTALSSSVGTSSRDSGGETSSLTKPSELVNPPFSRGKTHGLGSAGAGGDSSSLGDTVSGRYVKGIVVVYLKTTVSLLERAFEGPESIFTSLEWNQRNGSLEKVSN